MSGSAVFAFGSAAVSNINPVPPAWSLGSSITQWTLLGGWIAGLFFVNVTAVSRGPGTAWPNTFIGLCPVDPATGQWADVVTNSGKPTIANDGGAIAVVSMKQYAMTVPLNGNAYQVALFDNPGTSVTLSCSLIVHD